MEWISVKDRLPDDGEKCLVNNKSSYGNYIDIAIWTYNYQDDFYEHLNGRAMWYKYDSEYGDYEVRGITHWMSLPEPPMD